MNVLFNLTGEALRWLAIFVITASFFSMMIAPTITVGIVGIVSLVAFTMTESKFVRRGNNVRFRPCRYCNGQG